MTDKQKLYIIRRWNKYNKTTKLRIAAEFFSIMRRDELPKDWWQFLHQKFSTINRKGYYCDCIKTRVGFLQGTSPPGDKIKF